MHSLLNIALTLVVLLVSLVHDMNDTLYHCIRISSRNPQHAELVPIYPSGPETPTQALLITALSSTDTGKNRWTQ